MDTRLTTLAQPLTPGFYPLSDTSSGPLSCDLQLHIKGEGKSLSPILCPQVSLTRSPPSESEGSDGRFLISYDRTLVIKEVSSEDIADMHSNLSNYHQVRPLSSPMLSLLCLLIVQLLEHVRRLPIPFPHYNPFRSPRSTWYHVFEKQEISTKEPLRTYLCLTKQKNLDMFLLIWYLTI